MSKHTSLAVCLKWEGEPQNAEVLLVCEESVTRIGKDSFRWSLPGGKCCAASVAISRCCPETSEETALREFQEETGYEGKIISYGWSDELETPGTDTHYKRHIFRVAIASGEPLQKKVFSHESPKWFSLRNLPRNIFFSHKKIIERIVIELIKK